MKSAIVILILLLGTHARAQDYCVSIMYGPSIKNSFNIGLEAKGLRGKWGGYFTSQGLGMPYTGETGTDFSDICDQTDITDYGVVGKEIWCMTAGMSYNLGFKEYKRSPYNLYGGIGFANYIQVSETYYYYKWLKYPGLNEGNLVTTISKSTILPAIEVMIGLDLINKGPVRMGIIAGFNSASLLIGYGYIGIALSNPD